MEKSEKDAAMLKAAESALAHGDFATARAWHILAGKDIQRSEPIRDQDAEQAERVANHSQNERKA